MGDTNKTTPQWMTSRKEAAEVVYKDLKEAQRASFEVSSAYGRWLIASLVLVHGGGVLGVLGLVKDAAGNAGLVSTLAVSAVWLLVGLLLALGCGFSTWLNWSFNSENYNHMANPEMLWNAEVWTRDAIHDKGIELTYWLSIVLGIASAGCTVGALWPLLHFAMTPAT